MHAKSAAGVRRHLADPLNRAKHAQRSQERLARWRDAHPDQQRANGVAGIGAAHDHLRNPANEAARALAIRRTMLAGIPETRWDEYAKLAKTMPASDARRIISEDEAAIDRRRLAALTPLERQLERVRNGATLVTVHPLRRPDHDFTLGGVATGML